MTAYTLVIPAYNAAAFIGDAVGSALAQSLPPARVIVVDDGSTDDTATVARAVGGPIEVLTQPNQGPGSATTRGMALVETEYVATLDADDLWLPGKIEAQFAVLADDSVDGVFGHWRIFRGTPDAAQGNPVAGWSRTTMLMRTRVAKSVGAIIDPPGGLGDMVDWLARVREAGHRLVMLPDVLALRRVHADSMTYRRTDREMRGYLSVARAALLRRRRRAEAEREGQ